MVTVARELMTCKQEIDSPALLLTELDGLVDDVLVVWELGGSEAGMSV